MLDVTYSLENVGLLAFLYTEVYIHFESIVLTLIYDDTHISIKF